MKYSKGFFVFNVTHTNNHLLPNNDITELWISRHSTESFECYDYYWMIKDKFNISCQFHDASVWIDLERGILIIFLQNELLISDVLEGILRKFNLKCDPYYLNSYSFLMSDGNLVSSRSGTKNFFNKVTTTMLSNDIQRVQVIESVL
jgi:hypothetical protein